MSASTPPGGAETAGAGAGVQAPSETRRRSRRGCIPCRKRHRKCDELKPKCGSCQERNVACAYKALTWVPDIQSSSGIKRRTDHVAKCNPSSASLSAPERASPLLSASTGTPVAALTTESDIFISAPAGAAQVLMGRGVAESEELAAILRSFRYDIAPVIDSSAPRSTFAVDILGLAQTQDVIMRAIVLVVEGRSAYTQCLPEHGNSSERVRELLGDLSTKDAFTARIGHSLLALRSFFGGQPSEWSNIQLRYPHGEPFGLSLQTIQQPLQALSRFQIKTELAHSLRTKAPLSGELASWARHHAMSASGSSPQDVNDASIYHLVRCINLVNSRPSVFTAERPRQHSGQIPDSPDDFESTWSAYWAMCTHWYQTRSQDMVPILETTALEAAVLTTEGPGFPVSIHTSPLSLQSNTNMHLACLLLLRHRPGLSAVIRPQRPFESRSWHSEKIAGNGVWNTFKEQWDPILISSLLLIAEEMTHQAQQLAIRDCLQRISREAGVDLQRERANLDSIWQSFREDHDIDFDY